MHGHRFGLGMNKFANGRALNSSDDLVILEEWLLKRSASNSSDDVVIIEERLVKVDLSQVRTEPCDPEEHVLPRFMREANFEIWVLGEDSYQPGQAVRINFMKKVKSKVFREKFYGYCAFEFDGIMYPYTTENFQAVRMEVENRFIRNYPPQVVPVMNPGGVSDDTPLAR